MENKNVNSCLPTCSNKYDLFEFNVDVNHLIIINLYNKYYLDNVINTVYWYYFSKHAD